MKRKTIDPTTQAELMLWALAMIWGGSFVAAKFSIESFSPYPVMVIRFFLGALLLLLAVPAARKRPDRITWIGGIELGLLLGIATAFQMVGLQYTTPANQTFIIVSYVVTVPLLRFVFRRVVPGRHIALAALFTVAGVGFLTVGPNFHLNRGDVLTFIMSLLFAVQILRIDRYMPHIDNAVQFTVIQLIVAGAISLALWFFMKRPVFTGPVTLRAVGGLTYIVVLNTAIAYLLQNYAQRYAPPDKSALIISSESLFGTFAAYVFAGEVFYPKKILGCVLILVGQFFAQVLPTLKRRAAKK
ncbi:putative DMT superfamily transporter inner membrane protein [Aedoeadaptatus ivorii]|uniref:Putative DMT superfamily transporter inner membrane protein n=1 Tax=Aedoeadaptatus ivorii TaxID=54006 RepID=A0A448UZM3_9FIRM|nr:DMT family transporter [Peptoniphilus ivorii]MDQ0508472.1 drug/metabolite transporter (DMT)-like permease [Peptoniphilus ivorii]VEJ34239.1 putative DMT superfamily transporter inner membrane protein [Peptoniphilus ivorii]